MRLFRWTLWALAAVDAGTGGLMFLSPNLFGSVAHFPVQDVAVMRGYGERITLLALVYVWLLFNREKAGRLLWLPVLDELLNTLGDGCDLSAGHMPYAVMAPMLVLHAVFLLLLIIATPRAVPASFAAQPRPRRG